MCVCFELHTHVTCISRNSQMQTPPISPMLPTPLQLCHGFPSIRERLQSRTLHWRLEAWCCTISWQKNMCVLQRWQGQRLGEGGDLVFPSAPDQSTSQDFVRTQSGIQVLPELCNRSATMLQIFLKSSRARHTPTQTMTQNSFISH